MSRRGKGSSISRRSFLKGAVTVTAASLGSVIASRSIPNQPASFVPWLSKPVARAAGSAKGRLTVVQGADAQTLDAGMTEGTVTANVNSNIYDTLVFRDNDMKIKPGLAESWTMVGNTTWRFKIRPGIKYHNGEDVTPEAVKFSLERVLDPAKKAPQRSYLSTIGKVTVVDKATVEIVTTDPDPILLSRLVKTVAGIVPPNYVQEKGDTYVATHPVGSGPFRFQEWVQDDHVALAANPTYWRGRPKIETLIFKPIPDASTRTAALQTGDVDIIVNVPIPQVSAIARGADTKVVAVDVTAGDYVGFNTLSSKPLADRRVRLAINYALDVPAVIKSVLGGYATRAALPLTPYDFGYVKIPPYAYNPDRAKQLLSEAGYGGGLELTFDTPNGRYPMDRQVSEALAGQLRKVGVKTELRVQEWGNYMGLWRARKVADLFMLGWGSITTLDADAALYDELHCEKPYSAYCNKALDEKMELARSTMDTKKRVALYTEIAHMINEDVPWAFLYLEKTLYGMRKRVNWQGRPDVILYMYNATVQD